MVPINKQNIFLQLFYVHLKHKSIEKEQDYSVIYKISVELDELIAKFYKEKLKVI